MTVLQNFSSLFPVTVSEIPLCVTHPQEGSTDTLLWSSFQRQLRRIEERNVYVLITTKLIEFCNKVLAMPTQTIEKTSCSITVNVTLALAPAVDTWCPSHIYSVLVIRA